MIAVDSNILVYAHREDSPWNVAAYACLAGITKPCLVRGIRGLLGASPDSPQGRTRSRTDGP